MLNAIMFPKAIPLPSLESDIVQKNLLSDKAKELYNIILTAEATSDNRNQMCARVLGYLLLYLPSETARAAVLGRVKSCLDEDSSQLGLYELGEIYVRHFIYPC
jgi:hypothetical protein